LKLGASAAGLCLQDKRGALATADAVAGKVCISATNGGNGGAVTRIPIAKMGQHGAMQG
jgi:hypothetical protein